jgi:hypothetical protein
LNEAKSILTNFFGKDGRPASMSWAADGDSSSGRGAKASAAEAAAAAAAPAADEDEEDISFPDEN